MATISGLCHVKCCVRRLWFAVAWLLCPFMAVMSISVISVANDTGKQVGRYLFLAALRSHCWQVDGRHSGSQEPEENGRRRTFWYRPLKSDHLPFQMCNASCLVCQIRTSRSL